MKKPRGNGRATIKHVPRLSTHSNGKLHKQFNPHYEVHHQDEPTSEDPTRQHFKLASGKREGK